MTFKITIRGSPSPTIAAEYECPEHGRFELDVERSKSGDAPDMIACPIHPDCGLLAIWCISSPLCRVRKVEAMTRGKWQKPERSPWTDTSAIAEGQPLYEWKEDRARIWEEKRKEDVVRFARENNERVIGGD